MDCNNSLRPPLPHQAPVVVASRKATRHLLHPHQFHDPAGDVPILHVEVAVFVPVRAVRAAEDSFFPLVLRNVVVLSQLRIGVVAQHGNDRVVLVENHHAAMQIGHGNIISLHGGGGRHAQARDDFGNKVAVEIVMQ